MKLRTQRPENRLLKAGEALAVEHSAELTLNEQIGIPPGLKEHWEETSLNIDFIGVHECTNQVHLMSDLITLFPGEADKFRQLPPLQKLIARLQGFESRPETAEGWSWVKLIAPELVPPISDEAVRGKRELMHGDVTNTANYFFAARTLSILFPEQSEELRKLVAPVVRALDFGKEMGSDPMRIMKDALMVDPSLHPQFHAYVKSHAAYYRKMAQEWRKNWERIAPVSTGNLFSAYKLLLADEIEVSPTGILLAVERPKLSVRKPLPERSLTP